MVIASSFLRSRLCHRLTSSVVLSAMLFSPVFAQQEAESLAEQILKSVQAKVVPGRYIVMMKEGSGDETSKTIKDYALSQVAEKFVTLHGFTGQFSAATVASLKNDPRVASIEPDQTVYAFAQTLPTGIDRIDADVSPTAKIDGIDERVNSDIAILDTGVKKSHKDLNVFKQVNMTREIFADDMNGHGTHVAGTAAALDNGIGVVGVAPGARIWAIKVLDRKGSGNLSDVVKGIDYVTSNASQIEVANMSLGCECVSPAMDAAIAKATAAGVVFVVAAGNSAKDATTFMPANNPNVIAVSAIADFNGQPGGGAAATCRSDVDDTFADFSNFGPSVAIAAPGVCITSTWKDGGYSTISGTSMASPHVTGAVGLYLATHSKPTNLEGVMAVKAALIESAFTQTGSLGFLGDPDGYPEPLLNVGAY